MANKKADFNYKPYQVPAFLAYELEKEAKERRQMYGEDISWSGVLREILDKWYKRR